MRVGFPIDKFIIGPGLPGIDKVCFHLLEELTNIEGVEILLFQDKYKDAGEFGKFNVMRYPSLRDLPFVSMSTGGGARGGRREEFDPPSTLALQAKDLLKRRTISRSGIDIVHYPTHLERPYRFHEIVSIMTFHDLVPLRFPCQMGDEGVAQADSPGGPFHIGFAEHQEGHD
jgi:hypothetical protein